MKKTILIVDDSTLNREMLGMIFEKEYDIIYADDGEKAMSIINANANILSAIFLDITMPKVDGISVLKYIASIGETNNIPVIMISDDVSSTEIQSLVYELGAADFISKPFIPKIVTRRSKNLIELFQYKNNIEKSLIEAEQEIKDANEFLINTLSTIVEFRNLESGDHIKRVKTYTKILAKYVMEEYPEYHLTDDIIDIFSRSSVLHDIGKIGIPDSILLKPGKLTPEEFEEMKMHTIYGSDLLDRFHREGKNKDFYRYARNIARSHHERYDGAGYPDGLVGEEIPIEAQIVSITDVYDALISKRVYKDAFDIEQAFEMIKNGECGIFSDKMLRCLELAKNDIIKATQELSDNSI